ncbi:DUF2283 domain-containing protein [Thermodesulforhabdus norvegica]|uniref:Uncharacterized protein YuzE n=1 Tax=Thermodesulforhabdus norvegica TaxID=39841 RepID=A0A1I4TUI3_9BACT|nr:DUF2283 domain-containing protein [Thermodesulforhabdus norvegica]SFM80448.1 Uncharacterized protein YuzE [Thermodesulforhabdus norvegica]
MGVKTTAYFRNSVLVRRPYLKMEWVEQALRHPVRREVQENGRVRYWVYIQEAGKYLPVVTEPDGETVHNAFFRPGVQAMKGGERMRLSYDPETDMLYIGLRSGPSVESEEIAPGFVLDFDTVGNVVGIEIEEASRRVELGRLELSALPLQDLLVTRPAVVQGKK